MNHLLRVGDRVLAAKGRDHRIRTARAATSGRPGRPFPVIRSALAATAGAFCLAAGAHADVLYDSLDDSRNASESLSSPYPAISFSTGSQAVTITSFSALLHSYMGQGTVTVSLFSDSNTSPGSLIAILGSIDDLATTDTVDTIGANALLAPDTRYWIQLSSTNPYPTWSETDGAAGPGTTGEYSVQSGSVYANGPNGTFLAEVLVSPAPEPSTWAMLLIGLMAIGVAVRRSPPWSRTAGRPRYSR
jgi:hypothetical protein